MIFSLAARPPPTGRPVVNSATVEKGNRLACWLWGKGYRDVDPIPFGCPEPDEVARRFDVLLEYVKRVCAVRGPSVYRRIDSRAIWPGRNIAWS